MNSANQLTKSPEKITFNIMSHSGQIEGFFYNFHLLEF